MTNLHLLVECCVVVLAATLVAGEVQPWECSFTPSKVLQLPQGSTQTVTFNSTEVDDLHRGVISVTSNQVQIATVSDVELSSHSTWIGSFNVTGNFLGYAQVRLELRDKVSNELLRESKTLPVTVVRAQRIIDHVFTGSVAILVTFIYINFGCALDMEVVKKAVKKPIAPGIGFVAQFLFMPLISFGLAKLLFPQSVQMQLGLFFTGVSPGGGASNMWTLALGGNLSLSMTMTTISSFAAFAMMPFWIFTLGRLIFSQGNIEIPYYMIAGFAATLIIPLTIGFLIQQYLPRVSKFMVRILKPCTIFLIIFIIVFAAITNFFIFQLFTWRIVVAGLGLPCMGYLFGWLLAWIFRQPYEDTIAISIETGLQNTGIAIFLLRTLGQPDADLTTVMPVAVSIMTKLPLLTIFVCQKLWRRNKQKKPVDVEVDNEEQDTSTALI